MTRITPAEDNLSGEDAVGTASRISDIDPLVIYHLLNSVERQILCLNAEHLCDANGGAISKNY
jgi:hypothetical protein